MPSSSLPEPSFIDRDATAITQEMVSMYETMTGKTLQPAQPERLMVDVVAYREMMLRVAIQEAAKRNLVRYAPAPMLDYLGELVCVTRLAAQAASTTVRLSQETATAQDVIVPSGARFRAKDGQTFSLNGAAVIPAGAQTVIGAAVAEVAGAGANGFLAGEIVSDDGDSWPAGVSGVSIGVSYGGADEEDDERLRSRILLGPEGFAVAGPEAAYRYHVLSAHQDLVDVGVMSSWPGLVGVYPLSKYGAPTGEMLDLVATAVNASGVRPLTDQVVVLPPSRVAFEIRASLTLSTWADAASTTTAVRQALTDYGDALRRRLGREVIPSKIVTLIGQVSGVYSVDLLAPTRALTCKANQWADLAAVALTVAGYSNAD